MCVVLSAETLIMVVIYATQHLGLNVENGICHLVPPTMIPGSVVMQCFDPLFALSVCPPFNIFVEGITH